jgi:predicted nucleotidyltransferase component of viral defense system
VAARHQHRPRALDERGDDLIERRVLERRAAELGITVRHVELDYVLHHLLAGFARDPRGLVFRGGTALGRVYWPDFRISEDIDFIAPDGIADFQQHATTVVAEADDEMGLDATLSVGGWHDDRLRAIVVWTTGQGGRSELIIDVVRWQRAVLPPPTLPVDLRYPDLVEAQGRRIPVLHLDEILANKWLMLDDREEPRDLFDLHFALTRGGVTFDAIAAAHHAAYRHHPMPASIERAARLESRWEQRLRHQVHDLLPFRTALGEVRRHFDAWRSSID